MGVVVTYFPIPTIFSIAWKVTVVMFSSGWQRYIGPNAYSKTIGRNWYCQVEKYEVIKHQT
jgi:hypothetical protein